MKVFVTGASGCLGSSVAAAFRRAGHEVWGLVRSAEKARVLAREEIHPVLGDLEKPETFVSVAEACSVLVHTAAVYGPDAFAFDRRVIETLLQTSRGGPRPKTLLYTSGTWVYGSTGDRLVDETSLLSAPAHVAERPKSEEIILNASGVRGLVLRPGCVYGRQGSLTALWFEGALKNALRIIGDGSADGPSFTSTTSGTRTCERPRAGSPGRSSTSPTDRARPSATWRGPWRASRGTRVRSPPCPLSEATTLGTLAECLALDQHVDARKAVRRLGWEPRHGGFVDEVAECYEAWKAWQA